MTKRPTFRESVAIGKPEIIGSRELLDAKLIVEGHSYRLVPVIAPADVDDDDDDEDAADLALLSRAQAESEGHDLIPGEIADRLFSGQNPVKAIREWRDSQLPEGMNQKDLATAADITQAYLSEIESGKKPASASIYKRLADVLHIGLDIIMPDEHLCVWRLIPLHLDNDDWRASTWNKEVIIRAPSEKAARWTASFAFGIASKKARVGQNTPINPWRQATLVEVQVVKDKARWSPDGPIALLEPHVENEGIPAFITARE